MKLRGTVTDDRSAPRLEHTTPDSRDFPLPPEATTEKENKKGKVISNTAGNGGVFQGSSINANTRLELTGKDETRGLPLKPLKIAGGHQLSDATDAHELSPKILPDQKHRLCHMGSTNYDQTQSQKKTSGDGHNEVTARDTVHSSGATASKENSNPARKFFNSLRSKKSMANLSKASGITTMPDTPDLVSSPPSKDVSRKEFKANAEDTAVDMVSSLFDRLPGPVNPVSQHTDLDSHYDTPLSRATNPVYGLSTANVARRPPQSLCTQYSSNGGPQGFVSSIASGKVDLSSLDEDTVCDEYFSEEGYTNPEASMGSLSMLAPKHEQDDTPDFTDDGNSVRQLTSLYLQNVNDIDSTSDLFPPEEHAALGIGSKTGSDDGTGPGAGATNLARVETTTGPPAPIADAARKMLEMSIAIDELHAAAEAADINTGGHHDRSPETVTEEQKRNYSAGMVKTPPWNCCERFN